MGGRGGTWWIRGATTGARRSRRGWGVGGAPAVAGVYASEELGVEHLPFKSDWIFILDADESITPELKDELLAIAGRPAERHDRGLPIG